MLLSTTVTAPGNARLARAAAIAAACAATVTIAITTSADHPVTEVSPSARSVARFHDLQANKAASMRSLVVHHAGHTIGPGRRYYDLQANKASAMRSLALHRTQQAAGPDRRFYDLEANKAGHAPQA